MRYVAALLATSICALVGASHTEVGVAQTPAGFTDAQAKQGAAVYSQTCASCHGADLSGASGGTGATGPTLSGGTFLAKWQSQNVGELIRSIAQTMPPVNPNSLSVPDVLSVTAFILQRNGAVAGPQPLTPQATTQVDAIIKAISPPAGPTVLGAVVEGRYGPGGPREILTIGEGPNAPLMDPTAEARFKELRAPLEKLTPVTDAMLRTPPPGDWLMWRRNYNGWGYSPLDQITRDNVKNLTVSWTWALNSTGMTEFTPIVHDGIMFLWNYGELIQALDASNGNLLWRFRQRIPADYSRDIFYRTKRALAIAGNKLIVPTTDMHLIALDMKTGAVVWDVVTDDFRKTKRVYNGGPLVVNNKVIMGASGCAPGGVGCFVTAHDLETGKELWRFNTIAQPGEPGDETWNGVPADKRWGASVWTPPSYDPELNLLFVGTGSPFPWSSVDRGTYNPKGGGKNGDSLYTSSTLAINPDTGKLVWHYQHLPNDTFDQDYAFERLIVPIEWQGRKRKAVITAGKPAVIEVLDAATGQFLYARDPGAQNIFTFDDKTGVKTLLPPGPPAGIKRCPSNNGARNFLAGAYDPGTNRYYLSVNDVCTPKAGEFTDRLLGLDLATSQFTMDIKSRVMQSSAKLTTAGGLLFSASADRYMRAYDVRDGKVLWQMRLQDVPNAFPITYMAGGKQYVAMIAGNPGLIGNGAARASAEFLRPEPASVLWVWQLP
jgi:alcohol dehydrogenase (cytochrome c)